MARKLSKKQKGFVRDYVATGNGVQSALNNYDATYNAAGVLASEMLKKPKIIDAINSIADQIPNKLLIEKHLQLLNKEGVDGIDANAVKSGLDMAYKLKGVYAAEKKEIEHKGNVVVSERIIALSKKYEDELKETL